MAERQILPSFAARSDGLGLIELHAATGELQWLESAHQLAQQMIERFFDSGEGFFDSEPSSLPMRARDLFDGAVPSGTAAACELLLRLAAVYDRSEWIDIAQQAIERQIALLAQSPEAAPALRMHTCSISTERIWRYRRTRPMIN